MTKKKAPKARKSAPPKAKPVPKAKKAPVSARQQQKAPVSAAKKPAARAVSPEPDPRALGHQQVKEPPKESAPPAQERKNGRPTKYRPALAAEVIERITGGESLRSICRDDHMPAASTFLQWAAKDAELSEQYARACAERAEAHAEEILEIADDGTNDWMEKVSEKGDVIGWQVNGEALQRSKLRVDTRKWLMEKMKPKKYGQKVELGGSVHLSSALDAIPD